MTDASAPPRPPVMADVARLAGVSHQTVSRVVNGSPSIRPETRERVQRAIEELGYRPNTVARALVSGRSDTIGIIGTEAQLFGPNSIQRTIEEAARAAGLFASSVSLREVTTAALDDAIEHLRQHSVEGIVMIAAHDDGLEVARSHRSDLPLVVVEGDLTQARLTVGVDQARGARMAVQHLLSLGHREIAHIAGPLNWTEARARRDGWLGELAAAGCRPRVLLLGDWSAESGYAAGQQIAADPSVSAAFAGNDQMAIGLLLALHEARLGVPDDLSVVGFDDIPEAAYLIPPLTTIRQDFPAVGRAAIEVLLSAIAGHDDTTLPGLIPPELVVRASTGPRTGGR